MKTIPEEARVKNTGRFPETCRWCGDSGYVHVGTSHSSAVRPNGETCRLDYEEHGPCPYCLRGFYEEFPPPRPADKEATRVKPPWGDGGFWAFREQVDLVPAREGPREFLSSAENARRLRELAARMGAIGSEMPDG